MSTICINRNNLSDMRIDDFKIFEEKKKMRQSQVLTLYSKGFTQLEIAHKLEVNQSTISRDIWVLKKESRKYVETLISEEIPLEFRRTLIGLDELIKYCWNMLEEKSKEENDDTRTKLSKEKYNILNLIGLLYTKRLQLLLGGDPKEIGDSGLNLSRSLIQLKLKELSSCTSYVSSNDL